MGAGASLFVVAIAIFVLSRTLAHLNMAELRAALAATSTRQIALGLFFTALSYLILTGYDALALRHLRRRCPIALTALASFTSYAVSFTLGFPLVTGGAVRYWIYGPAGLSAGQGRQPHGRRRRHFLARHGPGARRRLPLRRERRSARSTISPSIVNQAIGARRARRAGRLSRLGRLRCGARGRGVCCNFELPGPMPDARPDGARRHRRLRRRRRVLYVLLPKGHGLGFPDLLRALFLRRHARHRQPCAGRARRVRGDDAQGRAAARSEAVAGLAAAVSRYILSRRRSCLALALLGANEAVRRWRSLREAMDRAQARQTD